MEANLNIKIQIEQLIQILKQLDTKERITIFKEFSKEWMSILNIEKYQSMTIKEYTEKLEQGLKDYYKGNTLTQDEVQNEVKKWKTQNR